jgi:hypothetical protein
MPNPGSYEFFNNHTVSWSYDSAKQELTVTATLNTKNIGSVVLSPGNNQGQLSGQDGQQTATVNLGAQFGARTLAMQAAETNPTKSGAHTTNF